MSEIRTANRVYYPALDGLRAAAFLLVFGEHYRQMPSGWGGVDVFFVLSGFLITGILFDMRDDPHRVRNFYVRRTLRIFPLYYGLILLLVLLDPIFRWQWTWSWLLWPAYLGNFCRGIHLTGNPADHTTLANFYVVSGAFPRIGLRLGHLWSLCVEEQFYLIWPWVVFWVGDRRKLLRVCAACVVICPLIRIGAHHILAERGLDQGILFLWTPFRVDALLLGGLIALVRRGPSPGRLLVAARVGFAALSSALVVWLVLHPPVREVYPSWEFTWGLVFIDLYSACLIVIALEPGSVIYRVFKLRPLRWLGRISYGAYVFHDIFHEQYGWVIVHFRLRHANFTIAALALGCTVLLAWASFRWYETPFMRLKDRWTVSGQEP